MTLNPYKFPRPTKLTAVDENGEIIELAEKVNDEWVLKTSATLEGEDIKIADQDGNIIFSSDNPGNIVGDIKVLDGNEEIIFTEQNPGKTNTQIVGDTVGQNSTYGVLTVGDTPIILKVGDNNLTGRHTLLVVNPDDTEPIYIGFDDQVLPDNGIPIFPKEQKHFKVKDDVDIYAISPFESIEGEDIGTGDGDTKEFSLEYHPVVPDSEIVYVDGTETTDYEINYKEGIINFDIAPSDEANITADYTPGIRLRIAEIKE